jgi:hypothetical protein
VPLGELEGFTRLMKLSCEISDAATALYDTEHAALGIKLMETADRLADEVGMLAAQSDYTADEVTQPLWLTPRDATGKDNHGSTRETVESVRLPSTVSLLVLDD